MSGQVAEASERHAPRTRVGRQRGDEGTATSGRRVRTTRAVPTDGPTLAEREQAVARRLAGLEVDATAMAAVLNVYRAAGAIRNRLERTVLAPYDLTWTAWVVLWVVWIWGEMETRHVAAEAGISKGTLTGVANTLQSRGLLRRRTHPEDGRRALLSLTAKGTRLMTTAFPRFNREESFVIGALSQDESVALANTLRKIITRIEGEETA